MPVLILEGREFAVDSQGFLRTPEIWNDEVARLFAVHQGIVPIQEEHWRVIRYIREYWQEHDRAPMIRQLCADTNLKLRRIYQLFPEGPAHGACKIAGLPKPDGCV